MPAQRASWAGFLSFSPLSSDNLCETRPQTDGLHPEGREMAVPVQVTFGQAIGMAIAAEDDLERAVREHARVVFQIAYSVLRNHADAEDATQETFLRAVKHRAKLPEIEDPKAWLARIAWRVAIDRKRARIPTASAPAGMGDDAPDLILDRLCDS